MRVRPTRTREKAGFPKPSRPPMLHICSNHDQGRSPCESTPFCSSSCWAPASAPTRKPCTSAAAEAAPPPTVAARAWPANDWLPYGTSKSKSRRTLCRKTRQSGSAATEDPGGRRNPDASAPRVPRAGRRAQAETSRPSTRAPAKSAPATTSSGAAGSRSRWPNCRAGTIGSTTPASDWWPTRERAGVEARLAAANSSHQDDLRERFAPTDASEASHPDAIAIGRNRCLPVIRQPAHGRTAA